MTPQPLPDRQEDAPAIRPFVPEAAAPVPPATVAAPTPLLVPAAEAARLCGMSRPTWDRHTSAGKTPAPCRPGGRPLWSSEELAAWCRHGCPPRAEWAPLWRSLCQVQARGRR